MKSEKGDQITEEARLKEEGHKCVRLKVEGEVLLTLEARQKAEEEDHLLLKAEEETRIA